jgi:hypothetical protein
MIQTSVAAPVAPRLQPESQDSDLLDPLWRLAGELHDARALIVADQGLDLMCGLIQRGCAAATVLRAGDKPDANNYNLVFVPQMTALALSDQVIRLALRSLAPNGRLIVGVQDGSEAVALARRLRLNGFSALQTTHLPGRLFLRADLRRLS